MPVNVPLQDSRKVSLAVFFNSAFIITVTIDEVDADSGQAGCKETRYADPLSGITLRTMFTAALHCHVHLAKPRLDSQSSPTCVCSEPTLITAVNVAVKSP